MLTDSYLRKHDYLRVSITDRCNLRCTYCMPPEGLGLLPHDEVLRNEEFIRLTGLFIGMGVIKVRFTGGEPMVRKGFIDILSKTSECFPGTELCLTTNGTLLGGYAEDLYRCRVKKLNVSLDTLSRERYRALTLRDSFDDVLAGIDRALSYDFFDVKINAVLFRETIDELDDFLEYFRDRNVTVRFIERMPFTADPCGLPFYPSDRLVESLKERGDLVRNTGVDTSVSMMYDFLYRGKHLMRIGIIPPMSRKFCVKCNRLRLTSNGLLKTCLHSSADVDLKKLMRGGADDDTLRAAVLKAVSMKHEGHSLDCASDEGGCSALAGSGFMSKIGG
jgi:GTP 3',8-cyclase